MRKHRLRLAVMAAVAVAPLALLGLSQAAQAQTAAEMKPVYNSGLCSTQTGGNWSDVKLTPCTGQGTTQEWYVQQNSDGTYNIIEYLTGDCMQDGNNGPSGTDLTVYSCNGSISQKFQTNGGEVWKSFYGNLCIDSGQTNRVVWWYTCNGTHAQDWE